MDYTYKITTESDTHIEVLYSSQGYPDILIGISCSIGERFKAIEENVPIARWENNAYEEPATELKEYKVVDTTKGITRYFDTEEEAVVVYTEYLNGYLKDVTYPGLPIEYVLLDDWYVAYLKYCELTNNTPKAKDACSASILNGDNLGLRCSHSVYNLSTNTKWSNTFEWTTPISEDLQNVLDANKDELFFGMPTINLHHIKIKDGEVTDAYTMYEDINGSVKFWVTRDLVNNELFEYYKFSKDNSLADYVMDKHLFSTDEIVATTFFTSTLDNIPSELEALIDTFNYKNTGQIIAWSNKSYGYIVEYFKLSDIEVSEMQDEALSALQNKYKEDQKNVMLNDLKNKVFMKRKKEVDGNIIWE